MISQNSRHFSKGEMNNLGEEENERELTPISVKDNTLIEGVDAGI